MKEFLFLLLFIFIGHVDGEGISLNGKVVDENRKPLAGIQITIDGNLGQATTDQFGHFHLVLLNSVKVGQNITLRCQNRQYKLYTRNIIASNEDITDITLTKILNDHLTHKHPVHMRPMYDTIIAYKDSTIWSDKREDGVSFSQTFVIPTESRHNIPGKMVSIPYTLSEITGVITRITRSCTSDDFNNRCRLNYMFHDPNNDPERFGEFAKGYEGTPEYLPDCHLFPAKNGFTYYRKWVGGECTEVYTAYYKKLITIKVKTMNITKKSVKA